MKVFQWMNKTIAFTDSWIRTLLIGGILGSVLAGILIFLQPFDTYSYDSPIKILELAGYAPVILAALLLVHLLETGLFRFRNQQWVIWMETLILVIGSLLMLAGSYIYNSLVINGFSISFSIWWNWLGSFGLPFLVFLAPLWLFLRARFGTIRKPVEDHTPLIITGQNKSEQFRIRPRDFLYAQSQQNYADIFYKRSDGEGIEKKLLRITLAQLKEQLPTAFRVHRSYLVNLEEVETMEGNARKRFLKLKNLAEPIPLSQKYVGSVKKRLSNSSQ